MHNLQNESPNNLIINGHITTIQMPTHEYVINLTGTTFLSSSISSLTIICETKLFANIFIMVFDTNTTTAPTINLAMHIKIVIIDGTETEIGKWSLKQRV